MGSFPFQYAIVRVHCHATEEPERVQTALHGLVGPVAVRTTRAQGHYGNPILTLEARLEGTGLRELMERIRKDRPASTAELDSRLNEDLFLYFRFDKQRAFAGELAISDEDDAIRLKTKVKVFPASRKEAIRALTAFFGEQSF